MAKDKMKPDDEMQKHASAKMSVLNELRNMAMGMMGDKMKSELPHEMHGVEVMAPDRKGLEKGLDLAKEVTSTSGLPNKEHNGSPMDSAAEDVAEQTEHGRSEPEGDEGEPDQEMLNPHRSSETEDMDDDMSHEEIDQMIEELKAKKAAKMAQR